MSAWPRCRSRDGAAAGQGLTSGQARQERRCSPSQPARGPEPRSRAGSRAPPDDERWVDDEVEFVDGAVGDLVEQELSARTPNLVELLPDCGERGSKVSGLG